MTLLLTDVVLWAAGLGLLLTVGFKVLLHLAGDSFQRAYLAPQAIGAAYASLLIIGLLCMRSLEFGVDTVTYAELFSYHCNKGKLDDYENSFRAATALLNSVMLGRCDVSLIPAAWILSIVVPILALSVPLRLRLYYLAAFLLSIVGIELATNALRQGLSVGMMLLAVSFGHRRPLPALVFAMLAVVFHSSAAMFLLAYMLAWLSWPLFLGLTMSLVTLTVGALDVDVALPIASEFIYEVQKYAAHEGDEIWIRVLAFACVLGALAAPVLTRKYGEGRQPWRDALRQGPYAAAIRLGFCCLPFLALPYFGYRFIYGVYPLILLLILTEQTAEPREAERRFSWISTFNVLILLAWSAGSSYMREVPFLTW